MSIKHAIVHQLVRNTASTLNLREEELQQDEQLSQLMNQTKTAFYNRSSKQYGQFTEESGHFKTLTQKWQAGAYGFVSFTAQLMKQLQIEIEQQELEIDGHWFFAHEVLETGENLWFFHLKHKEGMMLTHDMNLSDARLIDFSKLGFGGYADLTAMAQNEQKYLTVSFGFGDRVLQSALLRFLNFIDTINTAEDTERFLEIVKAYSDALPQDKGSHYRKKAVEYCAEQDKLGETVVADELVEALKETIDIEGPDTLVTFMEAKEPETKREFIPNRASLKKFQRYTGKTKEVSISFTNEILGRNVNFDPATETLTISELPANLLKQLKSAIGNADAD
jgi:nucleoid-associated protein